VCFEVKNKCFGLQFWLIYFARDGPGFGLTGNGKGNRGAEREDERDPALVYNFGLFILRPKEAGV